MPTNKRKALAWLNGSRDYDVNNSLMSAMPKAKMKPHEKVSRRISDFPCSLTKPTDSGHCEASQHRRD